MINPQNRSSTYERGSEEKGRRSAAGRLVLQRGFETTACIRRCSAPNYPPVKHLGAEAHLSLRIFEHHTTYLESFLHQPIISLWPALHEAMFYTLPSIDFRARTVSCIYSFGHVAIRQHLFIGSNHFAALPITYRIIWHIKPVSNIKPH